MDSIENNTPNSTISACCDQPPNPDGHPGLIRTNYPSFEQIDDYSDFSDDIDTLVNSVLEDSVPNSNGARKKPKGMCSINLFGV